MQVVFDFANSAVVINGDGPEVVSLFSLIREIAPKLPTITVKASGVGQGVAPSGNGGGVDPPPPPSTPHQTMRQFVRSLSLGSLPERVTAIAYYQEKTLSRPTFSPKDMGDWFTQCGLEKPNQMAVTVFDTKKRNGFIENAGH